MVQVRSCISTLALLSVFSTSSAEGIGVTFDTQVKNPGMPTSAVGVPVCVQEDGLLVSNCDGAVGPPGPQGEPGTSSWTDERGMVVSTTKKVEVGSWGAVHCG